MTPNISDVMSEITTSRMFQSSPKNSPTTG